MWYSTFCMSNEESYSSFEDTISKPVVAYSAFDNAGNKVVIKPKHPERHQSADGLDRHPTVFHNLDKVLKYPDTVMASPSRNPRALEHKKIGEIKIFEKKDYLQALNLPGQEQGDVLVIVKYEDPSKIDNPQNYTLTYRILR